MNNPKTLSLVIPCYNEERTLANCVKRVLAIATADLRLELIIVDDSSTDKSLMVAHELAKHHPEVTVLHHDKNRGKGAAFEPASFTRQANSSAFRTRTWSMIRKTTTFFFNPF